MLFAFDSIPAVFGITTHDARVFHGSYPGGYMLRLLRRTGSLAGWMSISRVPSSH